MITNFQFGSKLQSHVVAILALGWSTATIGQDEPLKLTEYGQPDLQGIWHYGTATPMERPESLGEKSAYSEDEATAIINRLSQAASGFDQPLDPNRAAPEAGARIGQLADRNFINARTNLTVIDGEFRTSQVVHPSNGRIPFRDGYQDYFRKLTSEGFGAFDGPETMPAGDRCVGPMSGPMAPLVGWFYNANLQIVQNSDYVLIMSEMNHDARIIPLSEDTTLASYPNWMGNSLGRWEGDTLIVETSGFRPEQSWRGFRHSSNLEVREEFRRDSENTIFYRYTVEDSEIYDQPFAVEKTLQKRDSDTRIYEYACHEGNRALTGMLAGARRVEVDALAGN